MLRLNRNTVVKTGLSGATMALVGASVCAWASFQPATIKQSTANTEFAIKLHKQAEMGKNAMLAPYSISSALAMTFAGAKNSTAEQMASTLNFTLGYATHGAFTDLNAALEADEEKDGFQLSIANRLWGQHDFPFNTEYLNFTEQQYGAGLQPMDFKNATEASRLEINEWVEDQTNERIKNLIPEGALVPNTSLVLTNAVYFLGEWESKFDENFTKEESPFHVSADATVPVAMMQQTAVFGYTYDEDSEAQVIRLPYKAKSEDKSTSMVIVLPKAKDGLENLEANLSADKLASWNQAVSENRESVILSIPKWRAETSVELSKPLQEMGMKDAFELGVADFSGMIDPEATERKLAISKVLHKTFIEVKEGGTEAAGATAVVIVERTSVGAPSTTFFRADHPFLYYIKDDQTGSILFLGRVNDPSA